MGFGVFLKLLKPEVYVWTGVFCWSVGGGEWLSIAGVKSVGVMMGLVLVCSRVEWEGDEVWV